MLCMREEDYKKAFQTIEMKSDMKERIISKCNNMHHKKNISKGARALIATACCVILFLCVNAIATYAYGYNLITKFYNFIKIDDQSIVEINMTDRRQDFKGMTATTPLDSDDKDLYSFLNENNMTNLLVPQNLTKDWTLTESDYSKAGSSKNLKPSISFTISNGTDQIDAFIDGGVSDTLAYQVGIDYTETKVVNDIEFLIIHQETDLTYEKYLKELENGLLPIMKISAEEFYKTNTYADLGTEEAYQRFVKYSTFVDFSTGGYDYSYCLTKGIDVDDFLNSLIQE